MRIAGSTATRVRVAMAVIAGLAAAAAPASADIRINEVESQPTDWVELTNTGAGRGRHRRLGAPRQRTRTTPRRSRPGRCCSRRVLLDRLQRRPRQPGRGAPVRPRRHADRQLRVRRPRGHDYGRCPDGTGAFVNTEAPTRGAANACPPTGGALARRRRGLDPRRRRHVRRERQRAGVSAVRHGRARRAVGRAQLRGRPRSSAWSQRGAVVPGRPADSRRRSSTRTGSARPTRRA